MARGGDCRRQAGGGARCGSCASRLRVAVRKREEAVDRDAILTGMWTDQDDLVKASRAAPVRKPVRIVGLLHEDPRRSWGRVASLGCVPPPVQGARSPTDV